MVFYKKSKEAVSVPVIAIGDIKNTNDAKIALKLSKADGVMIGRACYGKPWLINQIDQELKNLPAIKIPTISEQKEIILNHFEDMIDHYGSLVAAPLARKHIGWYSSGLKGSAEFRAKINTLKDIEEIKKTIISFYNNLVI